MAHPWHIHGTCKTHRESVKSLPCPSIAHHPALAETAGIARSIAPCACHIAAEQCSGAMHCISEAAVMCNALGCSGAPHACTSARSRTSAPTALRTCRRQSRQCMLLRLRTQQWSGSATLAGAACACCIRSAGAAPSPPCSPPSSSSCNAHLAAMSTSRRLAARCVCGARMRACSACIDWAASRVENTHVRHACAEGGARAGLCATL
jgi:hypothetical protein